ncbi:MAG: hypothetical protein RLZZ336_2009 [Cyanobacteriota bacterium]|jgi:hypothetical protein
MPASLNLRIAHQLPNRVRMQWPPSLDPEVLDRLCDQLTVQTWLRGWQRREASRSLVLELEPGCPAVRWQLALAALGCQLEGPQARDDDDDGADVTSPWVHLSRQMGGNLIGAALGQAVVGGGGAALGAAVAGPGLALALGGLGSVLGAVIGSIIGSAVADGQADAVPHTLGQLTWRRLSTRVGEEAGSSTGMVLGSALAGPLGAVAGLAVGSMVGGQLATDLSGSPSLRRSIGHRTWFVGMLRDTTAESFSERLAAGLGAGLTGGSEVGRQVGGSLGLRFSRRIDWNASLHQHHLVPLRPATPAPRSTGGP